MSNIEHISEIDPNNDIFIDVLRNIEIGIFIIDQHNKEIIFANTHAKQLLETIDFACNYETLYRLLCDQQQDVAQNGLFLGGGRKCVLQVSDRFIGYSSYPLDGDRKMVAMLMRDITDQKRFDSIAEAVEISNNIGYIFSGIRHEIGNPLNSVKMTLAVLKKNLLALSREDFEMYFERMSEDITKMESLLKAFKNFNMFEKPKATKVNLNEFFESFFALTQGDVRRKNVKISLRIAPESQYAMVDARALHQVAMNLMANALDALIDREQPRIDIVGQRSDNDVLLSFMDNGCGMSDKQQKYIFQPFHTSKINGTGLGLVIVKKMLAQMNCDINVQSLNGIGTTIMLRLPAWQDQKGNHPG